jgi:type I restriction enzyme S subunit
MATIIPLSKASKIIMGQSPPGDTYNEDGVGLPLLNGPTEFGPTHPECSLFTTDSRRECEPGDLIFCVRGSTTGRMNWADIKYSLGRGVCAFRASTQEETRFVQYCIQDRLAELLQLAGGGTFPNLTKDTIESFEIPWPEERVRIAGILSAYDELIENSQRRIKILESMARALYREWFVHFRFPGYESVPRVASPLGEIPQGWEGTLGDFATIDRDGINPFDFPDEQFDYFSIPAYDDGRTPAVEAGETIRSNKYCIDNACVLLSKLNPRIPRVWLPSSIGSRRAITSTEFLVLKPKAGFSREFVYSKCCSDDFTGYFASLAIGTSTSHQRVRPANVLAMPSAVPSATVVEKFTNQVAPMLEVCEKHRAKVNNLRRTRDLLLPRLLSEQIVLKVY